MLVELLKMGPVHVPCVVRVRRDAGFVDGSKLPASCQIPADVGPAGASTTVAATMTAMNARDNLESTRSVESFPCGDEPLTFRSDGILDGDRVNNPKVCTGRVSLSAARPGGRPSGSRPAR
ncbi:hypothetical protein [Streptosporangium sp. H16]|uniref:hypothetical protein n=1 Tax=Streptosporangium sp. H16 TaxID=3444184 RepID=UPI003F796D4D